MNNKIIKLSHNLIIIKNNKQMIKKSNKIIKPEEKHKYKCNLEIKKSSKMIMLMILWMMIYN